MNVHRSLWMLSALIAVCTTAIGCGQKSFPVAPVSGTIKINGKPVEGAKIRFQPVAASQDGEAGGGSYGTTDAQGNYKLMLILEDGEGAVVGKHKVFINTGNPDSEADNPTIVNERVPADWREGQHEFEVPPEGTTTANFEITSPR